jgi:anti-sigma regulatory factor (Ser/Thr protein kinase)
MCDDTSPLKLPARFSSLGALLDRVATACKDAGLGSDFSRRVELAIEELFANSIRHSYCGESDQPVWIRVSATASGASGVCVEYQDAGPPFDTFKPANLPGDGLSPEMPVGGLGLRLIKGLATTYAYERQAGRNIVSLEFVQS